jgi:hypothetical protein
MIELKNLEEISLVGAELCSVPSFEAAIFDSNLCCSTYLISETP